MNRQLIAQQVTALRGFDRIDVADDVGDSYVGRGEFFDEASVAIDPVDARHVAVLFERLSCVSRDWVKRIVVDFRTRDYRQTLVKEFRQLSNDAALRLAAQTEQDDVVTRQNRVDELRNDGVVVTDNAGEQFLAGA